MALSQEAKELWAAVQKNHKALETCPGPHRFQQIAGKPWRYVCTLCQGEIDGADKWHYDQGLEHGKLRL